MENGKRRIVFFPPRTILRGTGPVYTKPENIRGYDRAVISALRGPSLGQPVGMTLSLQLSSDKQHWAAAADVFAPLFPGEERVEERDFDAEWIRMAADITPNVNGENPGIATWAVGDFFPRGENKDPK